MRNKLRLCPGFILLLTVLMKNVESSPSRPWSLDDAVTRIPKSFRNCSADADCLEDEFCRTKTLRPICVSCADCIGVHHRLAKYRCAKTGRECGDCIPGYKEFQHSITERKCREISELMPVEALVATPKDSKESSFISRNSPGMWVLAMMVVLIIGVLATGALVYIGRRVRPVIIQQPRIQEVGTRVELEPSSRGPQNDSPPSYSDCENQLLKCNGSSKTSVLEKSSLPVMQLLEQVSGADSHEVSPVEDISNKFCYEIFCVPEETKRSTCLKQTTNPFERGTALGDSVSEFLDQAQLPQVPPDHADEANNEEVARLFEYAINAQSVQTLSVATDTMLREDSIDLGTVFDADDMALDPYVPSIGEVFVLSQDAATIQQFHDQMDENGGFMRDFTVEVETRASRPTNMYYNNLEDDQVVPEIPDGKNNTGETADNSGRDRGQVQCNQVVPHISYINNYAGQAEESDICEYGAWERDQAQWEEELNLSID